MHVRTANSRKEVFFPLAPPFFKKRKKVCNEDHKFVATSLKLTAVDLGLNTDDVLEKLHDDVPKQITQTIRHMLDNIKIDGANYTLGVLEAKTQELKQTENNLTDLLNKLDLELRSF